MNVDKSKLKIGMWYEDNNGNVVPQDKDSVESPTGATEYHTQYPLCITENIYGLYTKEMKTKCKHPHRSIERTNGWVKGVKGRCCKNCGCDQVRKWWQPWGFKWDSGRTSYSMISFNTNIGSGNEDIILAMANSGDYTLGEAIIVYSSACERCMNVLAYKYLNGTDGYPEYSEDWERANTECDFCRKEK